MSIHTCLYGIRVDDSDCPCGYNSEPLDLATCGTCGLTWDDGKVTSITPAPSARCPFEWFHRDDDGELDAEDIPADWPVQPI